MDAEDKLKGAEAEFQAEKKTSIDDGGVATDHEMKTEDGGRTTTIEPLASEDVSSDQPRKKLKLTEADKKRSVRMFGSLMVSSFLKNQTKRRTRSSKGEDLRG